MINLSINVMIPDLGTNSSWHKSQLGTKNRIAQTPLALEGHCRGGHPFLIASYSFDFGPSFRLGP